MTFSGQLNFPAKMPFVAQLRVCFIDSVRLVEN